MSSARELATRLLQSMMVAAVVLPAALFGYACWTGYSDIHRVADERIVRSLDVMQEQALKVLQTVDRTFAEVNEIVRGMSDEDIRIDQPRLHQRLASIVATMPQLQGILLIGRDGQPLATSALASVPADKNFSDRDYFQVQRDSDSGTYVSDVRAPRLPGIGTDFFDLSHRMESPDGSFNGVIAVAVRPGYFEDFYELIGRTPGSFYALIRDDGAYLARFPAIEDRSRRLRSGEYVPKHHRPGYRPRPLYGQFGSRWRFAPRRFSQASGIPGLRSCRGHHVGTARRMVIEHGGAFDLRSARHPSDRRRALGGAAPHARGFTRNWTDVRWRRARYGRRNGSRQSGN